MVTPPYRRSPLTATPPQPFGRRNPALDRLPGYACTAHIQPFTRSLLAQGLKPKSVNNYLAVLRRCLQTAVEWDLLERIPRFTPLKVMRPSFRFLDEASFQALVTAAGTTLWGDLVLVGARTGLRFGELAALEWSDIDFSQRLMTVQRSISVHTVGAPKNSRIRHVPLSSDALRALAARPREGARVFLHEGRVLNKDSSRRHLHAACLRAGIRPHGWHVLRHTFASHLAQAGVSLQAIMELLGHSSLTMVLRYAHLAPSTFTQAIAALEPKAGPSWQPAGNQTLEFSSSWITAFPRDSSFYAIDSRKHHAGA